MFHGPLRPVDGIEHWASLYGVIVDCIDPVLAPGHDLTDSLMWTILLERVEACHYDGVGGGPPCSSFSAGCVGADGGPRALSTEQVRGFYGIAGLTPDEKERVRTGTLLAIRMADTGVLRVEMSIVY